MRIGRVAGSRLALLLAVEILCGAMAAGLLIPGQATAAGADAGHVRVVIVVGPVGSLTDTYRALANEAASAARARGANVVTVYSPNATWPAVRRALAGASVVVYLGHGNGWPSPYRTTLYGRTQNGLGLNPVAGVDDDAHQYFGESYLARHVRLAPGAVVVLGHLCYASGNPEPGGPDPTVDVAQQRADNYAAGWMAAGATAVIAEGHGRPSYYVARLLAGRGTIEGMWRSAPTFHDHVIEMPSARTAGASLMLDPDHRRRGYFRSLAVLPGARVADTLDGAATVPTRRDPVRPATASSPRSPSPADQGARFNAPLLEGRTVASSAATLTLPVDEATLDLLPREVWIGTRWDPMRPVAPSTASSPAPSPDASPEPVPPPSGQEATPSASPAASEEASGSPQQSADAVAPSGASRAEPGSDPPVVDLIGPETPGTEVSVVPSVRAAGGLTVPVTLPEETGLYRLVTTVHDGEGVALDAATQDLIPALLVRVTDPTSATYGVPAQLRPAAGAAFTVRVRVANTGTASWDHAAALERTTGRPIGPERAPLLVARWIGLDDVADTRAQASNGIARASVDPGRESIVELDLTAPRAAGRYLLLFDLQMEDGQSLAALGVPPGITLVVIGPKPGDQARRELARGGKGGR
jgi:Ig-like domain-containing protein